MALMTESQIVPIDMTEASFPPLIQASGILHGVAASPGCVEGLAFVYRQPSLDEIPRYTIGNDGISREFLRFEKAVRRSAEEIRAVRARVEQEVGTSEACIFDAHLCFLEDPQLADRVYARVRSELINAEQALSEEIRQSMACLGACQAEYIRERVLDLKDVGNRLVRNLIGRDGCSLLETLPQQSIIVAGELTPSDTMAMDRSHVAGLVTEQGGATSHAAILARSMDIPAITGVHNILRTIRTGTRLLLDGGKGVLIIDPTPVQARRFATRRHRFETTRLFTGSDEQQECVMKHGTRISIQANIGRPEDIVYVKEHHFDGIGLFRSELLYLKDEQAPGLQQQCHDYQLAAEALVPLPITIRTFDFGADKIPRFLDIEREVSVLKGLRGLRFALQERRLFKVQLRALARVCREHANVRVLFPMVVGRACLREALALFDEQCEKEGLPRRPPVGAMIETPAAVFSLQDIVGMVDFLHIGSNDLAQYVLAEDRSQTRMEAHEMALHPAMLRVVQTVTDIAGRHKCPVCLCGEAAGDPLLASVMVGLGVRSLSMSPVRAQGVRFALKRITLEDAEELARHALEMDEPADLLRHADGQFPSVFLGSEGNLPRPKPSVLER